MSEIVPFPGSSNSAPARDFTSSSHPPSRFAGGFSGDRTPGGQSISAAEIVVEDDNNEPNEWISQIEPAIDITFISLPEGGNDLKRIRFSRDIFDRCKAQRWWRENFDRIVELYNVQRVNRQALDTLAISDNGRDSSYLRLGSSVESPRTAPSATIEYGRNFYDPSGTRGYFPPDIQEQDGGKHFNAGSSAYGIGGTKGGMSSWDVSRTTTSSQDDASISVSNASEIESEWIVEEEEGVYITIRQLTDGTRELKRVRFSREKFGEVDARLWFEANQDRIQAQYL
ncbi:hypothetical protein LIER_37944 [Lithospermum erythrorhizon]|uniref:BRX domain-containing protein n=1 Tax=Lithospermum erythrorhizon TaxID=34254 RepID=A0AAV3PSD6_LITER